MNITKTLLNEAKTGMFQAVLASAVSAAAGIAIIAGINNALKETPQDLTLAVAVFVGLLLLLLASSVYSQTVLVKIGYNMVFRLRSSLVNRILNTSIERQEQLGGPKMYNVLTRDVNQVAIATRELPVAMYNGLLVIAGIAYLCWLSPLLFGFVAAVMVIGIWSNNRLANKLQTMLDKVRRLDDTLFKQYEAVVEGRNELALNPNRRKYLVNRQFIPSAEQSRDQSIKAEVLWALNLNWTTLLVFALIGVIFYLGITIPAITQDIVVGYILAIMFLRTPLAMVIDTVPAVVKGNVALGAINRLALSDSEQAPTTKPHSIEAFKSLQLNQAVYQYPSQKDEPGFTLGPANFEINAGELVFIVGGNGSGKSTLAKILTGLYTPTGGELLLNGQTIDSQNVEQLRYNFSAIFANFFLFTDVIDAQGETTDDAKIEHYLKRLAIDHKVKVDNGKLSTTSLSQGQRKRLALLLTYMEDRQVLLLDEWAADQDPVFREVFYREILPELQRNGKTIIAISHDDHYFDAADRIYKLDCGQIYPFDVAIKKGIAVA